MTSESKPPEGKQRGTSPERSGKSSVTPCGNGSTTIGDGVGCTTFSVDRRRCPVQRTIPIERVLDPRVSSVPGEHVWYLCSISSRGSRRGKQISTAWTKETGHARVPLSFGHSTPTPAAVAHACQPRCSFVFFFPDSPTTWTSDSCPARSRSSAARIEARWTGMVHHGEQQSLRDTRDNGAREQSDGTTFLRVLTLRGGESRSWPG